MVAPPTTTFTWSDGATVAPQMPQKTEQAFSVVEVRDIVIAWFALGVAFFLANTGAAFNPAVLSLNAQILFPVIGRANPVPVTAPQIFLISLLSVGPGFVLHELSHKFAARRYGFWAEFRMWPLGLVLALATSLIGFIFAAPGATYISGVNITKEENGIISLAGPLTNVVIGIFFLPILLVGQGFFAVLGFYGFYINVFLALFNMLPILPLDGAKVFSWSKARWASVFLPLILTFAVLLIETGI